jgi:hypothetical protein
VETPQVLSRDEAARSLALVDVSPFRPLVEAACRSEAVGEDPSARFWLSLSLARAGERHELELLIADVGSGDAELPSLFWGDPQEALVQLIPGPSLPRDHTSWLEEVLEHADLTHDAQRIAKILLESEERTAVPALVRDLDPVRAREAVPVDDSLSRAEAFLGPDGRLRDDWPDTLAALPADERSVTGSALVTALLARATDVFEGNVGVEVAHALGDDYVPDVRAFADLYSEEGRATGQIAWAASRGGARFLVTSLADRLANLDTRPDTAAFLKESARFTRFQGPLILGGGVGAPEPPRERPVIEDFATAAAEPPPAPAPAPMEAPPSFGLEVPPPSPPPPVAGNGEPARQPEAAATTARWLQAFVYDLTVREAPVRLERAFRSGALHRLEVAIAPPLEDALPATGDESFDEALGRQLKDLELTIVFVAVGAVPTEQAVQQENVRLPVGGSARACFEFQVLKSVSEVRIGLEVRHGQRTIQPAAVVGPAAEDPSGLTAEEGIHLFRGQPLAHPSTLGSRSAFDGVVSVGAAEDGAALATVGDDRSIKYFNTANLTRATEGVETLLTRLVTNAEEPPGTLDHPDAIKGLYALAMRGVQLNDVLGKPIVKVLVDEARRPPSRIQLLLKTESEVVPLELVYDLPAPAKDARLCENWEEALRTGQCDPRFHPLAPDANAEVVCPSGFWGVSKLIERQLAPEESFSGDSAAFDVAARCEPTQTADVLPVLRAALFAASRRVLPEDITELCTSIRGQVANTQCVESWETWCEGIASQPSPSLLVLLTHTVDDGTGRALELGEDDTRYTAQVNPSYVSKADPPRLVVLLLGCETAGVDRELQSFVAQFRLQGASLVVGTICTVLAKRAPRVAAEIVTHLGRAATLNPASTAGAVLQTVRRDLLARGELTALALVAYGDVDWRLTSA